MSYITIFVGAFLLSLCLGCIPLIPYILLMLLVVVCIKPVLRLLFGDERRK